MLETYTKKGSLLCNNKQLCYSKPMFSVTINLMNSMLNLDSYMNRTRTKNISNVK